LFTKTKVEGEDEGKMKFEKKREFVRKSARIRFIKTKFFKGEGGILSYLNLSSITVIIKRFF